MKKIYNKKPKIKISKKINVNNYEALIEEIKRKKYKKIVIETYPGVRKSDLEENIINKLKDFKKCWTEDYSIEEHVYKKLIKNDLTEDRVFGFFTRQKFKNFFNQDSKIANYKKVVVYGICAHTFIEDPDLLIYIDMTRWEIQKRYRNKEKVFFGGTLENENTKNFKRGYFVEWRMADKIKKMILKKSDFYVSGDSKDFKWIKTKELFYCLNIASKRPFRLVPYFDYGVWGGKWMEKFFSLGKNKFSRWAWGFDGVVEENSIIFEFEKNEIEVPAINLTFFETVNLLGERVRNRFGDEFPIRFDFLDTIKGQNLSLQVHPDIQYAKDNFGLSFTQEESYYILDTDDSASFVPSCYLGFKNKIDKTNFIKDLENSKNKKKFNVDKYINKIPVKKHDHLLHPAGVIHSSSKGCMVLEISSNPYIFTFKLWDWDRKGLNGLPRPINIERGKKVIDYSFDKNRTKKELVNNFLTINNNRNFKKEKTGLHARQFIDTFRYTIKSKRGVKIENQGSVNMLNLVDGDEAVVQPIKKEFEPLIIRYAETFIVPASCKSYIIKPTKNSIQKELMVIQALVR